MEKSERERMIKSVAQMIGRLSVGFSASDFLIALSLAAAGIIYAQYTPDAYKKKTSELGKQTLKFLKEWKQ